MYHSRPSRGRPDSDTPTAMETVRLDVWLWAARFYKTRSQAKQACDASQVRANDEVAKPSRIVRVGDTITAKIGDTRRIGKVLLLSEVRGPAPVARALYDDLSPPPLPRLERIAPRDPGAGRPTKRERRVIDRWTGE